MKEPYSDGEIACMVFAILGYAFGAAILRMILFDVFPRVPETFWLNVYWFTAGAVFAMMLRKIRHAWGRS